MATDTAEVTLTLSAEEFEQITSTLAQATGYLNGAAAMLENRGGRDVLPSVTAARSIAAEATIALAVLRQREDK